MEEAVTLVYAPGLQSSHAADSTPVVALINFFPAAQEVQSADDSPAYFPSAQASHANDSIPVVAVVSL